MTKETRKIEVVPYDSHWPELFESEAYQIKDVLPEPSKVSVLSQTVLFLRKGWMQMVSMSVRLSA